MDEENDKYRVINGLRVRSDDPAFSDDQLVECNGCGRTNPPNRTQCIYCGAELSLEQIRADLVRPNLVRPEQWESGYSIVVSGRSAKPVDIAAVSELIDADPAMLGQLLSLGAAAPICYLRSLTDAHLLASRLTDMGLDCCVAGDDLLAADVAPTRLRRIEFSLDGMTFENFNTAASTRVHIADRILLVIGTISRMEAETDEKRRRKETVQTDEAHSFFDEPVLDIYPSRDVFGFRIRSTGFDFSCLGDQMEKFAAANLAAMIEQIRRVQRDVVLIDRYAAARSALDSLWPRSRSQRSSTVQRRAFGGIGQKRTALSDNTVQFTKFSRLQRHFL